jgi:hypothetical protein
MFREPNVAVMAEAFEAALRSVEVEISEAIGRA